MNMWLPHFQDLTRGGNLSEKEAFFVISGDAVLNPNDYDWRTVRDWINEALDAESLWTPRRSAYR
jgi:hypothetical protein